MPSLRCALLGGAVALAIAEQSGECTAGQCPGLGDSLIQGRDRVQKVLTDHTESEGTMAYKEIKDLDFIGQSELFQKREAVHGDGHHSNHGLHVDGSHETPAWRRNVEAGFVREFLIKFPLKANKKSIQMNDDGTATVMMNEFMEGRYVRTTYQPADPAHPEVTSPLEQTDYGVEKVLLADQHFGSGVSTKSRLAFAGKSHTFYAPEGLSRVSEERHKAELAMQDADTTGMAKIMARGGHAMRTTLTNALVLMNGRQLKAASHDPNHIQILREASYANDGEPGAELEAAEAKANKALEDMRKKVTAETPIASSLNCLHFEQMDLMTFKKDHSIVVPLNKRMVAWRGMLKQAPNHEYAMSSGISIWRHDKETDTLDIFVGYSSVLDLVDTANGWASMFSVGHADGKGGPIATEGRMPTPYVPAEAAFLYKQIHSIPRDFNIMHTGREEQGCDQAKMDSLATHRSNVIRHFMVGLTNMEDLMYVAGVITLFAQCGADYVRPDSSEQVYGYGWPHAVGMIHLLSETPAHLVLKMFQNPDTWNKVSIDVGA